jgi:nucleotide-binding universal stress UspA family protein
MSAYSPAPIVVGVDGSRAGWSAVRAAASEAALHDRPLRIVHAYNWTPAQTTPSDDHCWETAEALLERAVSVARRAAPRLTTTTSIFEGPAVAALLRESRTAALLAIGDGGIGSRSCVSVHAGPVQIAARADCPVLVARETEPAGTSIVVGTDGSAAAEPALAFAFDAADRRGVPLTVVRVCDADGRSSDDGGREAAELAQAIGPWEEKYSTPARVSFAHGNPADALLREAETAGLVVVAARGQRPHRGLLGSVSQRLLHRSPAPLVIVRGPAGTGEWFV